MTPVLSAAHLSRADRPYLVVQRSFPFCILVVLAMVVVVGCGQVTVLSANDVSQTPIATPPQSAAVQAITRQGIQLGAAAGYTQLLQDGKYRQTLTGNFSLMTPENELKSYALEPKPGVFTFQQADTMVRFAHANHMQVWGDSLVMRGQYPAWLTAGTFTAAQARAVLHTFITTVVSHFRGQIEAWDVVDEAVDNTGALDDDFWMRTIGPTYIPLAFTWAHEADPDALLFYNDYGAEGLGTKSDAVYSLIESLLAQGVPIQGVGLQMHVGVDQGQYPPQQDVTANMARLKALGLKVAITEMDVQIHTETATSALLNEQAQVYGLMAAACRSAGNCVAFCVWGVTDRYSWIKTSLHRSDAPLLFDMNYSPKPAYTAVINALS